MTWVMGPGASFSPLLLSLLGVFASILITCLTSLAFTLCPFWTDRNLDTLLCLGAGCLLGDVFLHIIPHSLSHHADLLAFPAFILAGILGTFLLETCFTSHHAHTTSAGAPSNDGDSATAVKSDPLHQRKKSKSSAPTADKACAIDDYTQKIIPSSAIANLFGDSLHNIVDGATLAASALASRRLGIASICAVSLHELGQEVADFALLRQSGMSFRRALFWNATVSCTTLIGWLWTVVTLRHLPHSLTDHPHTHNAKEFIGGIAFNDALLAISAGNFLHLALSDMLAHVMHKKSRNRAHQTAALFGGVALMTCLFLLE